jgi:hypothetical protein
VSAANSDQFEQQPKTISADQRWQALLLATMNQERAELCSKEQGPLRTFLEMNAKFLMEIAS